MYVWLCSGLYIKSTYWVVFLAFLELSSISIIPLTNTNIDFDIDIDIDTGIGIGIGIGTDVDIHIDTNMNISVTGWLTICYCLPKLKDVYVLCMYSFISW